MIHFSQKRTTNKVSVVDGDTGEVLYKPNLIGCTGPFQSWNLVSNHAKS